MKKKQTISFLQECRFRYGLHNVYSMLCLGMMSLFVLAACDEYSSEPVLEEVWKVSGLATPESVLYDSAQDELYVSNMDGGPTEKDGRGFISRLSPQGDIIELNWVSGFNAPKGMGILGDTLYVADIDRLVAIDIMTGEKRFYEAPNALFLNDIAIDSEGTVYVSDMMDDTIYALKDDLFSPWLETPDLAGPNGLLITETGLIVGSWGVMREKGSFETETSGSLQQVTLSDASITPLTSPLGNLDGVERFGEDGYTVTDWVSGGLWRIDSDGQAYQWLDLNQGSADHESMDGDTLIIIPMMLDNEVVAYRVKS